MPDDENNRTSTPLKRETARRNAMEHFAASERRDVEVRKEIERQKAADTAKTAKLRALRLAKEESDRLAAASAPPPPPKTRKSKAR